MSIARSVRYEQDNYGFLVEVDPATVPDFIPYEAEQGRLLLSQLRREWRQLGADLFNQCKPEVYCWNDDMRAGYMAAADEFNEWLEQGELLSRPYGPEVI